MSPPFQEHPGFWTEPPPRDRAARLLRWRIEPEPVDGGMPEAVGDLVSRWLCRMGRVRYPHIRTLLGGRVRWRETRDPAEAAQMFHCIDFPWHFGLQGALIGGDAGSAEPLGAREADILTGGDWAEAALPGAIRLRAAVDGEAILLAFETEEAADAAIAALKGMAEEAGVAI